MKRIVPWIMLFSIMPLAGCDGGGGGQHVAITKSYTIAASADDGHYREAAGVWNTQDTATSLVFGKQTVVAVVVTFRAFLRFPLDIPVGSTITAATLNFEAAGSVGSFAANINLIDADNCGDIDSFAADQSDMTLVSGPIVWTPDTWVVGTNYASVDISALVNAYVDRPGYALGQYIGFLIDEGDAGNIERRHAGAFDHLTAAVPTLTVTYTPMVWACRVRDTSTEVRFLDISTKARLREVD